MVLDGKSRCEIGRDRGGDVVEREIGLLAQSRQQNADQAEMRFTRQRKQQMKAAGADEDVEVLALVNAERDYVGDKKFLLMGRTGKPNAAQMAHRTVRTVAAGQPLRAQRARGAVRGAHLCHHTIGRFARRGQLTVPLHRVAARMQPLRENVLVRVLSEREREGGTG